MDSESEKLHLNRLKQFVYDEDKIVTSVSLSKDLNISIQSSQTLLKQFIENQKPSSKGAGKSLGVSYTLTGTSKDSENMCIMIVKHDQLDEQKKLFKSIKSELVYSVQKAADIDFNAIGLVNMLQLHGNTGTLLGCLTSKNCVLRKDLRDRKVLPATTRAAGTDKSKATHLFSNKSKEITKTASAPDVIKKEPSESNPPEKKPGKLTKQNSGDKKNSNAIANMFAKAPPPKEKPVPKEEPVEAMDVDADDTEEDVKPSRANGSDKSSKQDLYDSGTDEEAQKVEAANKAKTSKQSEAKTSTKKRASRSKRQREDKSVERQPEKKRKRILQYVESDEDIFADDDEDEQGAHDSNIIMSDEDDASDKSKKKPLPAKNRNRKYVEKTYTDEEGYIVTKKELVYESAESEEDDKENPPKVEAPKKATPKETKEISPPTNKKKKQKQPVKPTNQPTLMNFFKKK